MNRNCLFLYIIRVINFNFQEIEKSRYKQQCRIRFNIITLLCVVDGLHLIIRFNIITLLCVECLHLIIRFNIITLFLIQTTVELSIFVDIIKSGLAENEILVDVAFDFLYFFFKISVILQHP